MAFTKKQEKEGTMISDWLNEHGNPEIEKKVEREAILKYGEPKQETLEEVAKRLFPVSPQKRKVWLEGAKWQAERMYSEEEIQIILSKLLFDLKHKKIPNSVEWFKQFKKK